MVGRLFLAVDPPDDARRRLVATIAEQLDGRPLPGRPSPPENWHLTLRFLGDTDEVGYERLLATLDQAELPAAFAAGFDGLGAFPRPERATVLWVGIDPGRDALAELANQVEDAVEAAGWAPEERPFRPHLTLARIWPHQDVRPVLAKVHPTVPPWPVDAVRLYRSHLGRGPARYEELEVFPL